jgi:hypothetical protein
MTLDGATVDGVAAAVDLEETLARVALPRPLAPGDSVVLRVHFRVHVPRVFDRFGRTGDSYSMGQWYPKIVVHEREGWALDPYHFFAEFYGEFAEYDVAVTLPDDLWVGATGELIAAEDGNNEIPLQHVPAARANVMLTVATADSLEGRWPKQGLRIVPLFGDTLSIAGPSGTTWSVPRGSPTHYRYAWRDDAGHDALEADGTGHAGPVRTVTAWGDTSVADTLRSLAATTAPGDTAQPSLKTLRFRASGVHDFAWVASPRYVRADSLWDGVAVRTLVFREDTLAWRGALAMTVRALARHRRVVGPYVWPSFTTAEAATAGGAMEYPMLTMNDPGLSDGEFEWLDTTLAHESAHNWFYGMVGNDERRHPWLDEGFAQLLEDDYIDEYYPRGFWKHRDRFRWVAPIWNSTRTERWLLRAHDAEDDQPPSWPADSSRSYSGYSIAAYDRPAVMFRSLRTAWGGERFGAFLRDVYRCGLGRHLVPADVYASANATVGVGADSLIRSWIETTGVPDVALGAVRRERTAEGWRTTVEVRRKGAIAMPVPVEVTYADGTRETRIVPTGARTNRVVFDHRERVVRAEIDPRHQVFDAYPLDNRGGLLPPMRWSPLVDVATPRAISVLYGPTLWHGEREGMRLGGWVDGRYLPSQDFPYGIRSFEGGLNVGTRAGSVAWRAGYRRRVGRLGARGSLRVLVSQDVDLRRYELSLSNLITESGRRHPWRLWRLTLQDLGRRGTESSLHSRSAELAVGLRTRGPRRSESIDLSWRHGEPVGRLDPGADRGYDRATSEVRQTLDLGPRATTHVSWRVMAGRSWRRVPSDRLFDPAQATPLETLDQFYWNAGGPLRRSEHVWAEGGGGLRGYVGRGISTDRLVAGSIEARHDRWPVSLFLDLGRVGGAPSSLASPPWTTLADAGIGWSAGPLRIYAPLWVGTPPSGESPWDARWTVAFDLVEMRWR